MRWRLTVTLALLLHTTTPSHAAGALPPTALPDDGFAGLDLPPPGEAAPDGEGGHATPLARLPFDVQAAFFLKQDATGLRRHSELNPGVSDLPLDAHAGFLETRFTLSDDDIEALPGTRWLLKTYTTSSKRSVSTLGHGSRVDELFVDKRAPHWFVSLGKRRVNWGHAQGFNPVNVVAPARNPLDPSFETEGQPMAWFSYTQGATVDLLYTQGNQAAFYGGDRPRWALRLSLPGTEQDVAFYAYDGGRSPDGQDFPRMLGASFSTNLAPGWTWYGELANFSRNVRRYHAADGSAFYKSGNVTQVASGLLLDLGGRSSFFVEGLYNGQGYAPQERERYATALASVTPAPGEPPVSTDFVPLSMNRGYLLASFRKEYREKFVFQLSCLGAADGSYSARTEASYALSDFYEVKAAYVRNAGRPHGEFANDAYKDFLQLQLSASF